MDELRWLVARHAESLFGGDEALAGTDDAEPSASPPEHHAATLRFDLSAATRPRFDLGALTPRVDLSALVRPTFDLSAVFGPALGTPFDFRVTALSQQLAEIVNAALIRPSFNAVIGRDLLEGADTLASSSPSNELARYRELQSLLVRVPVALVVGLVIGVALQELTPRQALVMALGLLLGWWPVDQDIARRIWSLESK